MFPRTLLKFKVKGGVMQPLFLNPNFSDHLSIAERALEFYESCLGMEKGSIDFDELRYRIGDDRLADGLRYALNHIFTYKPKVTRRLKISPTNLRLKLFKFVGSLEGGFARNRVEVLKRFKEECDDEEVRGLELEDLDDYLWSDYPKGYVLVKVKDDVSPIDVIKYYNYEVLDTLLSNSRMLIFMTKGSHKVPKGMFVKEVVRRVKEFGLIYDAQLKDDYVLVSTYGPIELFGKPTRFASRLSMLFNTVQPFLKTVGDWSVKILVHLKKRDLPCILTDSNMPDYAKDMRIDEEIVPIFDSRVERKFYMAMSSVSKYRIEREAEPIIVGDTLIVPDYTFHRIDGVKWYLEIIGYWRPEYVAKKKAKLMELKRAGFDKLILLVENSHIEYFKDIGFPVFPYRMKG
ncbi:MAG: DUF790 family protein, partial [Nitrososphaerota archaeon]|nr:DUF790 family protein [Nitrososphaerales archaeon]MDW8044790.1 DUF790 family protein [Nitrososphaerota archaeon]